MSASWAATWWIGKISSLHTCKITMYNERKRFHKACQSRHSQRYRVRVQIDATDIDRRIVHVEKARIDSNQVWNRCIEHVAKAQRTQGDIRTLPLERKYTLQGQVTKSINSPTNTYLFFKSKKTLPQREPQLSQLKHLVSENAAGLFARSEPAITRAGIHRDRD